MIAITGTHTFAAAHRAWNDTSKCNRIHGHNYTITWHVTGRRLDDLHRLVDFDVIKTKLNAYVEDRYDHKLILEGKDPLAEALYGACLHDEVGLRPLTDSILWTDFPTSVEGFAQHFLYWVPMDSKFNTFEYWVHKVEVQETPKYTAVAELDYP